MLLRKFAVAVLFMLFIALPDEVGAMSSFKGEIIFVSPLPGYSGYIKTWVGIKIKNKAQIFQFYLPYFEASQEIPKEGQICNALFVEKDIEGQIGSRIEKIKNGYEIIEITCE